MFFDLTRTLYLDLNSLKESDFDMMIYHTKDEKPAENKIYLVRTKVELILFLSQLLSPTKTRY